MSFQQTFTVDHQEPETSATVLQEPCNQQDLIVNADQVISLEDEEFQGLQLSKRRELEALSLDHRLRNETVLFAHAKTKDEVEKSTSEFHLQEMDANQAQLDKEIANLEAEYEALLRETNVEDHMRLQLEKEMQNTTKMATLLQDHYEYLKGSSAIACEEVQNLKREYKENVNNYEAKKQQLFITINDHNHKLEEIKNILNQERLEYESEMSGKNDSLRKLNELELKVAKETAELKLKDDQIDCDIKQKETDLVELLSKNESLHNSIKCIPLEETQNKQVEKKQNYEQVLLQLENDFVKAKESLNKGKQREAELQEVLEKEINYTRELETQDAKLEEELLNLLEKQKELKDADRAFDLEANQIYSSVNLELEEAKHSLSKYNEEAVELMRNKTEKINNLHVVQQTNLDQASKINDLKNTQEKLLGDIEYDTAKLVQLEQTSSLLANNFADLSSNLHVAKENYITVERAENNELNELTKELSDAEIELARAKEECGNHIKNLQDELSVYTAQTEEAERENDRTNQQNLKELERELANLEIELNKENVSLEHLETVVEQKQSLLYQMRSRKGQLSNNLSMSLHEQNINRPSILKSPGKPNSPKNVSWRIPSSSTIDFNSQDTTNNQMVSRLLLQSQKTSDELFEELLRHSPPQKLFESTNKAKRSRLN